MSFSVPLWSSPRVNTTPATYSPRMVSIHLNTPWAAGCAGPKCRVVVPVFISVDMSTKTQGHHYTNTSKGIRVVVNPWPLV